MDRILGASILILSLQRGWVSGQEKDKGDQQQVKQNPPYLTVQEGDTSILNCTYENSAFDYFPWYRQLPGKSLELLIAIRSVLNEKEDGRFKVFLKKSDQELSLHIRTSQLGDSATYFCAAQEDNNNRLFFGDGTQLVVKPIIENPEPAVYQLRDPKSRNTSVCLFTDFDSNVNLSESVLPGVPHTQPTVLNMKSLDSKSNAAVAWSSKSNFDCRNTFGDPTFYPSSDYPCNATLVEESFETDMNLNLENLSVMALRILLLKVAGFNLLMTLRLWSS